MLFRVILITCSAEIVWDKENIIQHGLFLETAVLPCNSKYSFSIQKSLVFWQNKNKNSHASSLELSASQYHYRVIDIY